MTAILYVPRSGEHPTIVRGSAIVGSTGDDQIHCYYEGNLYDAENLRQYRERALVAAARWRDRAPTVAQMLIPAATLRAVAHYDLETYSVVDVIDEAALLAWSGESLSAITGMRLDPGPIDRNDPDVRAALSDLRPAGQNSWRTIAGQIVRLTPQGGLEISG